MELFGRELNTEVCLVAEVGSNHEGDMMKARYLIAEAVEYGADAVKFQSYTTELLYHSDDARFEQAKKFELSDEQLLELKEMADIHKIDLFASCITHDKAEFLGENFPAIKIASADLTHKPTIEACVATGKPLLISTGMANYEEILATSHLTSFPEWDTSFPEWDEEHVESVVWMHCVSAYPTSLEDSHVALGVATMQEFGSYVGYSNHTPGIAACLSAIACEASVVEVHFTDKKDGRDFRDHALSCDAADLRMLRHLGDDIKLTLASGGEIQDCEIGNRKRMRKDKKTGFRGLT